MKNQQKIEFYEKTISLIQNYENYSIYVCNKMDLAVGFIENIEKTFPEFFLFKEINYSSWLNKQLVEELAEISDIQEYHRIINEYRIFILQLCIEMCNE